MGDSGERVFNPVMHVSNAKRAKDEGLDRLATFSGLMSTEYLLSSDILGHSNFHVSAGYRGRTKAKMQSHTPQPCHFWLEQTS